MAEVIRRIADMQARSAAWRAAGERIAFVPTMGNLHAGHLTLVAEAVRRGQRTVVSIFVNPLQFGEDEDYDHYPRTLEADLGVLAEHPVDVVFAPEVAELYPRPQEQMTQVEVPALGEILCGRFRPGHFRGVATVVSLLFNLVDPHVAVFGEKDYQQLAVIRRMVEDLRMSVEIVGAATAREASGLAMSSRNRYLSAEQRTQAAAISAALRATLQGLAQGRRDFEALEAAGAEALQAAGLAPQYYAVRGASLEPPQADTRHFVVLTAALLGQARLIDNMQLVLD